MSKRDGSGKHRAVTVLRRIGTSAAVVVTGLLLLAGSARAAEAVRAIDAAAALGCCVCRGTAGGNASAVRACSDARTADSCVSACKGMNADSIAFGYQQTCSQGCAGFPTQNLK